MMSAAPAAMVILCQVARATILMERLMATMIIMPLTFLCLSGASWFARKKAKQAQKDKVMASKDEPLDIDLE